MVSREYELYQVVTPGELDGNGRSCLMGIVSEGLGLCRDVVGRSNVR